MVKIINGLIAIVAGVGGITVLFWLLNAIVERLPDKWEQRIKPYVFIGPAMFAVGVFLVYPGVRTIILSFFDATSENFVGLRNYQELVGDPNLRSALFNNILWILFVPTLAVVIGLLVAVLADRLRPRWEKVTKSVIFLPMAISFVGASTIWGFVYAWRPPGTAQIGILNAVWTAFGGEPQTWLQISTARLNT